MVICILSMEMDKGGKDATEFLKCTGWYGHTQIPGNHNAESPNQNLLKKDRSFYEVEGGWFLLGLLSEPFWWSYFHILKLISLDYRHKKMTT